MSFHHRNANNTVVAPQGIAWWSCNLWLVTPITKMAVTSPISTLTFPCKCTLTMVTPY